MLVKKNKKPKTLLLKKILKEVIDLKEFELKAKKLYLNYLKQINESTKKPVHLGSNPQKFINYKKIIKGFNDLFPLIAKQEQYHFERCNKMIELIEKAKNQNN